MNSLHRVCAIAAGVMVASVAWAADTPGTIRLLSKNAGLTDRDSNQSFLLFSAKEPVRLLITGPSRIQVDARILLPSGPQIPESALVPATLEVLDGGNAVGRLKVQPAPGTGAWKNDASTRPSASLGFFLDVGAGPHAYEIRVDAAAARGVAISVVPADKAEKPIAANSPVLAAPAPAAPSKPAATPSPAKTPAPQVAKSVDEIETDPNAPRFARVSGQELYLSRVNALGAGLAYLPDAAGPVAPYLSYRTWLGERWGVGARASFGMHSGRVLVSSAPSGQPGTTPQVARGQAYDGDFLVTGFWNVQRQDNSAFFLQLGAGPAFHKEIRQSSSVGLRALTGLGFEFSPASIPSIGFTLEGGFRTTSYKSDRLGTTVEPAVGATFHYYLNRKR